MLGLCGVDTFEAAETVQSRSQQSATDNARPPLVPLEKRKVAPCADVLKGGLLKLAKKVVESRPAERGQGDEGVRFGDIFVACEGQLEVVAEGGFDQINGHRYGWAWGAKSWRGASGESRRTNHRACGGP